MSDKPFFSSTLDWFLVKVSDNFFLLWRWKSRWVHLRRTRILVCFLSLVLFHAWGSLYYQCSRVPWVCLMDHFFFPHLGVVWGFILWRFFFLLCYGIFNNYYIKTFKLHFTYMFSLRACLYVWLCTCQDIVWRSEDSFNELVLFFLGMELVLSNLVTSTFIHWVRHLTNQFFGSFFLLSVFTVFLSYKSCYMNAILTELTHYVFFCN